jgi:hypothetical protein
VTVRLNEVGLGGAVLYAECDQAKETEIGGGVFHPSKVHNTAQSEELKSLLGMILPSGKNDKQSL